jgi:acetate kinase
MTAALDGLDALVFIGGVGEYLLEVRSGAVDGLGFLGLAVDELINAVTAGDRDISAATATARTLVVRAREDVEIVHQTRRVLEAGPLT